MAYTSPEMTKRGKDGGGGDGGIGGGGGGGSSGSGGGEGVPPQVHPPLLTRLFTRLSTLSLRTRKSSPQHQRPSAESGAIAPTARLQGPTIRSATSATLHPSQLWSPASVAAAVISSDALRSHLSGNQCQSVSINSTIVAIKGNQGQSRAIAPLGSH